VATTSFPLLRFRSRTSAHAPVRPSASGRFAVGTFPTTRPASVCSIPRNTTCGGPSMPSLRGGSSTIPSSVVLAWRPIAISLVRLRSGRHRPVGTCFAVSLPRAVRAPRASSVRATVSVSNSSAEPSAAWESVGPRRRRMSQTCACPATPAPRTSIASPAPIARKIAAARQCPPRRASAVYSAVRSAISIATSTPWCAGASRLRDSPATTMAWRHRRVMQPGPIVATAHACPARGQVSPVTGPRRYVSRRRFAPMVCVGRAAARARAAAREPSARWPATRSWASAWVTRRARPRSEAKGLVPLGRRRGDCEPDH